MKTWLEEVKEKMRELVPNGTVIYDNEVNETSRRQKGSAINPRSKSQD